MTRTIHKQRRKFWFRVTIGLLAAWLVVQANPGLAACLRGSLASGSVVHTSSEETACCCHGTAGTPRMHNPSGHQEVSGRVAASESGMDGCTPCHCVASGPVGSRSSIALSSSGIAPVWLVLTVMRAPYRLIDSRSDSFPNPPLRPIRWTPLFLLKSSLLI